MTNLGCINESEISKNSIEAFKTEEFDSWAFENKKELSAIADIFFNNSKEILEKNRKSITKISVNKYGGRDTIIVLDKNQCITLPIKNNSLVNIDIQLSVKDSLKSYFQHFKEEKINNFIICKAGVQKKYTLAFNLNIRKKNALASDYRLRHIIYKNKKITDNKVFSKKTENLRKSIFLNNDLQYVIEIIPYSGW